MSIETGWPAALVNNRAASATVNDVGLSDGLPLSLSICPSPFVPLLRHLRHWRHRVTERNPAIANRTSLLGWAMTQTPKNRNSDDANGTSSARRDATFPGLRDANDAGDATAGPRLR